MKLGSQFFKEIVRKVVRRTLPAQIQVATGRRLDMIPEEWIHAHISFSQYGEDLLVWDLLRRDGRTSEGFYVDIGAFDPILYSNTNLLHRRGWTGLNVDLNDEAIVRFDRKRTRDTNLQCAVSDKEQEMILCKYPADATNRLFAADSNYRKSLLGEDPIETKIVRALPLSKILEQYLPRDARFDLLDVDCEGHDLAVLKSNDWSKYRPFILAVEDVTNEPNSETVKYCIEQGYDLAATLFISRIFLDRNASEQAKAAWRVHASAEH